MEASFLIQHIVPVYYIVLMMVRLLLEHMILTVDYSTYDTGTETYREKQGNTVASGACLPGFTIG
jgi:hypothetical protein